MGKAENAGNAGNTGKAGNTGRVKTESLVDNVMAQ
jgi:hypothetical protein